MWFKNYVLDYNLIFLYFYIFNFFIIFYFNFLCYRQGLRNNVLDYNYFLFIFYIGYSLENYVHDYNQKQIIYTNFKTYFY